MPLKLPALKLELLFYLCLLKVKEVDVISVTKYKKRNIAGEND